MRRSLSDRMTLLAALLAPAVVEEKLSLMSPEGTLTHLQGSDSRPLAQQVESCGREEWTGEGKPH